MSKQVGIEGREMSGRGRSEWGKSSITRTIKLPPFQQLKLYYKWPTNEDLKEKQL